MNRGFIMRSEKGLTHTISSMGFALLEVMIAVSILAVISQGVMTLMKNTSKSAKNLEQNFEINNIMVQVATTLRSESNCSILFNSSYTTSSSLVDLSGTGTLSSVNGLVPDIRRFSQDLSASFPLLLKDTDYGSGQGRVKYLGSQFIVNPDPAAVTPIGFTAAGISFQTRSAVLELKFERLGAAGSSFGSKQLVRRLPIFTVENAGNTLILKCFSEASMYSEEICNTLNGVYDAGENQCRNLKIEQLIDPLAIPAETTSFTSLGNLRVGTDLRPGAPGVPGNLLVDGNSEMTGTLLVNNTVTITPILASNPLALTVTGQTDITGKTTIDSDTGTVLTLDGTATTLVGGTVAVNTTGTVIITSIGDTTIDAPTTRVTEILEVGDRIYQRGMHNELGNGFVTGDNGLVATVNYVRRILTGNLSQDAETEILSHLLDNASNTNANDYGSLLDQMVNDMAQACPAGEMAYNFNTGTNKLLCRDVITTPRECGPGGAIYKINSNGSSDCRWECGNTAYVVTVSSSKWSSESTRKACIP